MRFILHNYRRCPFSIRARILLYLKGFEYDVVEEPLRKWTKWMRDWSARTGERARIPVLRYFRMVDGKEEETILPESNDIDYFLDSCDGNPMYTPEKESEGYQEMKAWWDWCDEKMKPVIDTYKYGENLVWDREKNVEHTQELRTYIQTLEEHLTSHEYLVEARLTLADIAVIPFIRQIMRTRGGEFDFGDFPHVVKWAHTILETDWFQNEVMKKHPLAEVGT